MPTESRKLNLFASMIVIFLLSISPFSLADAPHEKILVDTDGDGMPDDWEMLYSLNWMSASDANLDYDGDGLTNLQEYNISVNPFYTHTIAISPRLLDSDNDTMRDGWEFTYSVCPGNGSLALDPTDNGTAHPWGGPDGDCDEDGFDENNDGIIDITEKHTNIEEKSHGTKPLSIDSDNDGMPDGWEIYQNLNPWNNDAASDSDADGISNLIEYQITNSSFYSGTFNMDAREEDSDGDGMWDGWEYLRSVCLGNGTLALDPTDDGTAHPWGGPDGDCDNDSFDMDHDGVINATERHSNKEEFSHGTHPLNVDSDSDGMPDGWEVCFGLNPARDDSAENPDLDNFGNITLTNLKEYEYWVSYDMVNATYDYFNLDPRNWDSDADGMHDGYEIFCNLNPFENGTALPNLGPDGDFDNDGFDWDGNGILEGDERFTNYEERWNGTLANDPDSDGDGISDGYEAWFGLGPMVGNGDWDTDNDGLTNLEEFQCNSHPDEWDTDGDTLPDHWEHDNGISPTDNGIDWARDQNNKNCTPNPDNGVAGDPDKEWEHNPDNQTLTNLQEYQNGLDPLDWDTDNDGMDDAWEVKFHLDGNTADGQNDPDGDTIKNIYEYANNTDPLDADTDDDGYRDQNDAFPLDWTEWFDTDGDGVGNNADLDDDNDTYADGLDAFPLDGTEWADLDLDGIGDNSDPDADGDGWNNTIETAAGTDPLSNVSFPADNDLDKIPDILDPDDDNDGVPDAEDEFPFDPTEWVDTDGDGVGNNADDDDDGDGVVDPFDELPLDANETVDSDDDGIGNNADTDDDGDGVLDVDDFAPLDPDISEDPAAGDDAVAGGSSWVVPAAVGVAVVLVAVAAAYFVRKKEK